MLLLLHWYYSINNNDILWCIEWRRNRLEIEMENPYHGNRESFSCIGSERSTRGTAHMDCWFCRRWSVSIVFETRTTCTVSVVGGYSRSNLPNHHTNSLPYWNTWCFCLKIKENINILCKIFDKSILFRTEIGWYKFFLIPYCTKFLGGQNFRQQANFSALLSSEILSDKVTQKFCKIFDHWLLKIAEDILKVCNNFWNRL